MFPLPASKIRGTSDLMPQLPVPVPPTYTRRVKRDLSKRIMKLPLRAKLKLVWRMFRDPQVPAQAKVVLPVIGLYVAMPFDLIPDFIPLLGQLDDLFIVAAGLGLFIWLTPRHIVEYHLQEFE